MKLKKIILSGVFLALCIVLPFFTMQIPKLGSILSPMHIPVLICGFVCGWPYGAIIGFIAPLLRSVLTGGFPPMYPTAVAMAFELFAYGTFTALFSKILTKTKPNVYISLIISMVLGRIVWGIAMFVLSFISHSTFTFSAFLTAAFIQAIPGIICHIIIVPIVVFAVDRYGAKYD